MKAGLEIQNVFVFEEVVKKNGKKYYNVISSVFDIVHSDNIHFDFQNLFNGNKELGDNILKVMNDNWEQVFDELGIGYEKAVAAATRAIANQVFSKISISELFDD